MIKNLPANAGGIRDEGSIPGLGISPGEGHGNPQILQAVFFSGGSHKQRSLASSSPLGHTESDMTEANWQIA